MIRSRCMVGLVFLVIGLIVLAGCQKDTVTSASQHTTEQHNTSEMTETPDQAVLLTIIGYKNDKILSKQPVKVTTDDSVWDVTVRCLKGKSTCAEAIPYSKTGHGSFLYVEGIGAYYEFDHGAMSGWTFYKMARLL